MPYVYNKIVELVGWVLVLTSGSLIVSSPWVAFLGGAFLIVVPES